MAYRRKKQIIDDEDANQLKFAEEFQNEECLLVSEVKVLLEVARERKLKQGEDLSDVMKKTLSYCEQVGKFTNKETMKQVRGLFPLKDFESFEVSQIANLCCETTEELKTLVPSLNRHEEDTLQAQLNEMHQLRKMQPTSM